MAGTSDFLFGAGLRRALGVGALGRSRSEDTLLSGDEERMIAAGDWRPY
jgi:hypothetical protein